MNNSISFILFSSHAQDSFARLIPNKMVELVPDEEKRELLKNELLPGTPQFASQTQKKCKSNITSLIF